MSLFPPGQTGPVLPDFKSLLVHGRFHPSASIHLCLSLLRAHPDPNDIIVFISPSSETYTRALEDFNDDWFSRNALTGYTASLLSRIRVLSPQTPAELAIVLSEIHIVNDRIETPPYTSETVLSSPPILVLIHDLSTYFAQSNDSSRAWTASSYIGLVIKALSMQTQVATPEIRLALFDASLDDLQLPLVTQKQSSSRPDQSINQDLTVLLNKYFEKTLHVSGFHPADTSVATEDSESLDAQETFRMALRENGSSTLSWRYVLNTKVWDHLTHEAPSVRFRFLE